MVARGTAQSLDRDVFEPGWTTGGSNGPGFRSDGVSFRPLVDRGCHVDLVMAWRRDETNTVRDSFLDLLRNERAEIERANMAASKDAATGGSHLRRKRVQNRYLAVDGSTQRSLLG